MSTRVSFAVLTFVLAIVGPTSAQVKPESRGKRQFDIAVPRMEFNVKPADARRGQAINWELTVELGPGWHTYPTHQPETKASSYVSEIQLSAPAGLIAVGEIKDPPSLKKPEAAEGINELHYYEGGVTWKGTLLVHPDAAPGKKEMKASLRIIVCDASHCLPPKNVPLTASFTVNDLPPLPIDPKFQDAIKGASSPKAPSTLSPESAEPRPPDRPSADARLADDSRADLEAVLRQLEPEQTPATGLWAFLLAGVFWGGVSLLTPCVFPMIPITVSFFLKQSEKEHHRPVFLAVVYSLTIVVVLTFAAVLLLSFFRLLSVSPLMNFALGLLFVFFALSLFGMYDIQLPSGLARLTSARQGQGGLVGTVFMALTFTIVSFACVAPFLGGFGGTAATSDRTIVDRVLGGLAFSVTFAAPFFVLALFPTMLKKLPKSGSWLNSVKVIMGFLELAAALKFFRAGELVLPGNPVIFTYDMVLGMWIALSILAGLYLLNVYRLPHDTPAEYISVPGLFLGFLFLSLAFYLTPALFKFSSEGEKQRPGGALYAWIDSFLLPEAHEAKSTLTWTGNLRRAIDDARAARQRTGQRKLIFIDFTGETCTNCKLNERNVFAKPEFIELLQPYNLVQMYTDKVPDRYYPAPIRDKLGSASTRQSSDAATNLWFQREAFGTEQLPLYVILEPLPSGKIVVAAKYAEGKINDEAGFAEFLRKPLQEENARAELQ